MDEGMKEKCGHCGKPATMKCSRCKNSNYCNADCQKLHWSQHKKDCEEADLETMVYRAGGLLQDIYLLFREKMYDEPVYKIEDTGDQLILYDGSVIPGTSTPFIPGMFVPFPGHLVANEKDKMMMLSNMMCAEPAAYLDNILSQMLKGSGLKIEELGVQIKKPDRKVTVKIASGTMAGDWTTHELIKLIDPKSSKQWIFDITGPQYNIFSSCMDATTYMNLHVEHVSRVMVRGTGKKLYQRFATLQGDIGFTSQKSWLAFHKVEEALEEWKVANGLSLPKVLRQSDNLLFQQQRRELLEKIGEVLTSFVSRSNFQTKILASQDFDSQHPKYARLMMGIILQEVYGEATANRTDRGNGDSKNFRQ